MTELCKFCVIFHRLYIDNIIKASKIKFKKIQVFFFLVGVFLVSVTYTQI